MLRYDQVRPVDPLSTYIDQYVFVRGTKRVAKTITPQTALSFVFDFEHNSLMKNKRLRVALVGIHDHEFSLDSIAATNDKLLIRISPVGLPPLMGISSRMLFNQIVDAAEVLGDEVNSLYAQLKHMNSTRQRIDAIESFLLKRLHPASASDSLIFELAEKISNAPDQFSFADLKQTIPFSSRQLERKFKALIGTNIQTYLRLARFEKAKSLLENKRFARLTDVGYEVGYYDQAHFSTEFKKLAGVAPKSYDPC